MTEVLKERVKARHEKFMKHYSAGDMEGVAELYTEDCVLMPQGVEAVHGKEGVKAVFGAVRDSGITKIALKPEDVYGSGQQYIIERATYIMYKGDIITDEGKILLIWKEIDGQIFLYNDIFNSNKSEPRTEAKDKGAGNKQQIPMIRLFSD